MAAWLREDKQDVGVKMVLFLISPFFSFLYSLRRIRTKSSFVIFFLFSVFFGLSFTVGKIRYPGSGDGVSYRISFENYTSISYSAFYKGFLRYFSFTRGDIDYYFDTVAFFVSRGTDNYHVMFMVFAIIFSFFQLKTFKFFATEKKFNNSIICLILAFLFTFNQIFNINGVRFWTAAWVGTYAIFQIFGNGNKRYFILAFITPFIHAAFWVYLGILVLGYFTKKYDKIWVILFFISFFISNLAIEVIVNAKDYLPPVLKSFAASYTREEAISKVKQQGTGLWLVGRIFDILLRVYINYLVYLFIRNSASIKELNYKSKNLYLFLLVWMTFVNFAMPVPSLGVRFLILAFPIIAYVWLINFRDIRYRYVIYLLPIVFFMSIYTLIGNYINVLDPSFYYSSPIVLLFKYLNL